MKKLLTFLLCILILALPLAALAAEAAPGDAPAKLPSGDGRQERVVDSILQLPIREAWPLEGSMQEQALFDAVLRTAQAQGYPTTELSLGALKGAHSFSKVLSVHLPAAGVSEQGVGASEAQAPLVIALPVGKAGAEDPAYLGSWQIAKALLKQGASGQAIDLVFLGGDSLDHEPFVGSMALVRGHMQQPARAYIYLALEDLTNRVELSAQSEALKKPGFIAFARALYQEGIALSYSPFELLLWKHAIKPVATPAALLSELGSPVYLLKAPQGARDARAAIALATAQVNDVADQAEDVAASYAKAFSHVAEKLELRAKGSSLFIYFHVLGYPVAVGEEILLLISLLLAILVVCVTFMRRNYVARYISRIVGLIWIVPLVFITGALALVLGDLLSNALFREGAHYGASYIGALLALRFMIFAFSISALPYLFPFVGFMRRKGLFAPIGSTWYLALLLIASLIDIRFVGYFLLPLLCALGVAVGHHRWVKTCSFAILSIFFLFLCFFETPSAHPEIIRTVLRGKWNILLFFFMGAPWAFLLLRVELGYKKKLWPRILAAQLLLILALLTYIFVAPEAHSSKLSLVKPHLNDCASVELIDDQEVIALGYEYQLTRGRKKHRIHIISQEPMTSLAVYIEGPNRIPLLSDSNVPVVLNTSATRLNFIIGRNPPQDFVLEFSLPKDFRSTLYLVGSYEPLLVGGPCREARADLEL